MAISVVGVDLSKSVFQLLMADAKHCVVARKRLSDPAPFKVPASTFAERKKCAGLAEKI